MNAESKLDVTAVIINYGSSPDTAELCNKLKTQVADIIVVDNSNDIEDSSPARQTAQVVTPVKNLGFGAAVNLAARQVATRWLLVLNPDVRLKRDCLQLLVEASSKLHAPVCGPRFYWDDACTLQLPPALGHPLWLLSDRHIPNSNLTEMSDVSTLAISRHEHFWNENAPFSDPVLSGACLLVDNTWFRANSMPIFDEDFFLYYEDTDLCGRLMRKGVMPVCVAAATAVHYWNQSSEPPEGKSCLMQRSEEIFLKKYYPKGPPPLPAAKIQPDFKNLGVLKKSPALILPPDIVSLDIGVQEDFIVFARAKIKQSSFSFSRNMWQRLRDGRYYFRAMNNQGQAGQYWVWEKASGV